MDHGGSGPSNRVRDYSRTAQCAQIFGFGKEAAANATYAADCLYITRRIRSAVACYPCLSTALGTGYNFNPDLLDGTEGGSYSERLPEFAFSISDPSIQFVLWFLDSAGLEA